MQAQGFVAVATLAPEKSVSGDESQQWVLAQTGPLMGNSSVWSEQQSYKL